ncbi:MAG TPA: hypothetical protein VMU84_11195, partial [Thermoanaerobaculia bacterium]|nr:hypothetical protein [Thermoanaerobaculia bacterium]
LSMRGDLAGARPYLERAVALDATDGGARLSLARVFYLQNNFAAAIPHLIEARKLLPNETAPPILLATAYERTNRWSEALPILQKLAGPQPDKATLRRIADCKKQIGIPLSDAERRASRRWWPFGGGGQPSTTYVAPTAKPASRSGFGKKEFAIAGIVIALIAGVAAAAGYWNRTHVTVWFDSVYPRTAFVVDGDSFVADARPVKRSLGPGKHHVVAKDASGKLIEQRDVEVAARGLFTALFNDDLYVYNVAAARVYRRTAIIYAANPVDQGYRESYIAGESFFEQKNVDYMFVEAPATIEISSGNSQETKIAFSTVPHATIDDIGMFYMNENKPKDAEAMFRKAIALQPCDSVLSRRMLGNIQLQRGDNEQASALATSWIHDCPQSTVDAHRFHQDVERMQGHRDKLIVEYRLLLNANPNSAEHHYLYGRMLPNPAESFVEFQESIRLDENLPWPHYALGYNHLAAGAFSDAMQEIETAMDLGLEESSHLYFTYAAIGAGKPEAVEPFLAEWKHGGPTEAWLVALAEKNWTKAETMCDAAAKEGASEDAVWLMRAKILALRGDDQELEEHIQRGKAKKKTAAIAAVQSIDRAFASGDFASAMQQIDDAHDHVDELYRLYAAAAAMLGGNLANGVQRTEELRSAIVNDPTVDANTRRRTEAYANALTGTGTDEEVLAAIRENDVADVKHAYFFLGARAAAMNQQARAREMFGRSAAMSFDLSFPLRAAQRLSI